MKASAKKKERLFSIIDGYVAFLGRQKWSDYEKRTQDLAAQKEFINRDRCHVALVGFVKRGKSTLLNALLGNEGNYGLSPVRAIPCTGAVVQYLDSRPDAEGREEIIVRFNDGNSEVIKKPDLPRYVDQNAEGFDEVRAKRIKRVEVRGRFPLIETRGVFVDTPGLGALRDQDDLARGILPEADLILYPISKDEPLERKDADFLGSLSAGQKGKLIYVFTKIDKMEKKELPQTVSYIKKNLRSIVGGTPSLYPVAAKEVLEAYKAGKSRKEIAKTKKAWGMKVLENALDIKLRGRHLAGDRMLSICGDLETFITMDKDYLDEQEGKLKAGLLELEERRKALTAECNVAMRVFRQDIKGLKAQWEQTVDQFVRDLKNKKADIAGGMISVVKKEKFFEKFEKHTQTKRAITLRDMLQSCLDEEEKSLKNKLKRLITARAGKYKYDMNVDSKIRYEFETGFGRLTVRTIPDIVESRLHEAAASIEGSSGKALESILLLFEDHQKTLIAGKQETLELANNERKTLAKDLRDVEQGKAELKNISKGLMRLMGSLARTASFMPHLFRQILYFLHKIFFGK